VSTVPPITTTVGHYSTDELRYRGKRVFAELLGRSSYGQILMLGLTGKFLDGEEMATVDDMLAAMASADPRLWPFKVARVASAFGTGAYGVAATFVTSQGGIFGTNRLEGAARWLVMLQQRAGANPITDDVIVSVLDEGDQGFGVLYRRRDERFEALMVQIEKRGRHELPFARLCRHAVRVARAQRRLEVHVYLGIAALCLDLGMSAHEIAMFGLVVLFHNALANAVEGAAQQPHILRELPRDRLDYRGRASRVSPKAASESRLSEPPH
jgi:hypothetical protein